jgi:tRNA wybutosine-synthesizing protein 3
LLRIYKKLLKFSRVMTRFEEEKKRALGRLQQRGADEEVEELLERINRLDDFFTTSSCSGRIVLIWLPEVGAKRDARFIGKWHRPVGKTEVLAAMSDGESSRNGDVWLIAQSPIMHVACKSLEKATMLLRIAIDSGFKYSGIKAIGKDKGKVMVEIMSTERMDVPLASNCRMFYSEAYLDFVVSKANFMLSRGKEKLNRFGYRLNELE